MHEISEKTSGWQRRLPILVILLVAAVGAFTLREQLSFEALAQHREALIAFRDSNFLLASLLFVAAYVVIVAFSLPGATIATLTGGFLFGMFPGTFYNVLGASLGAVAVFLAARAGFGADVARRIEEKGGAAARLQSALRENEWSALLIMRLVPAVPLFLADFPASLSSPLPFLLCADDGGGDHPRGTGLYFGRGRAG